LALQNDCRSLFIVQRAAAGWAGYFMSLYKTR